jgi:RNA ligase partner protein
MKRTLVIDTSVFVNPASGQAFGNSPTQVLKSVLELAQANSEIDIVIPPSIYNELMYFIEPNQISPSLLLRLRQQAPKKHELKVPGFFIYSLVESFRDRVDRGLRLAERNVREAIIMAPPPAEKDRDRSAVREDAKQISTLRESFRRMMREGMLDSKADVDLLLLAYELGATLVSADEGVVLWAENLGVAVLPYSQLRPLLLDGVRQS